MMRNPSQADVGRRPVLTGVRSSSRLLWLAILLLLLLGLRCWSATGLTNTFTEEKTGAPFRSLTRVPSALLWPPPPQLNQYFVFFVHSESGYRLCKRVNACLLYGPIELSAQPYRVERTNRCRASGTEGSSG